MLARGSRSLLTLLVFLLLASAASAHPMGNFSVNHYSRLTLEGDRVEVQYIIDLAEIPTYQELQEGAITADPLAPAVKSFIARRGVELGKDLSLTVDGSALLLRLKSSGVIFPPGAGGLPTMKMGFVYEATYPASAEGIRAKIHYADATFPGHTGWKEIVVVARAGALLQSTAPSTDRSAGLTDYPTDLLSNPPQMLEASFVAELPTLPAKGEEMQAGSKIVTLPASRPNNSSIANARGLSRQVDHRLPPIPPAPVSGYTTALPAARNSPLGAVQLQANQQKTPRSRFTELITAQRLSPWFLFTAALLAMCLGALHALEPGHGKTIVAAYLVGSRGTARHAALLGVIVTLSHTAGVFAIGAVTLYASRYIVPEQLYPWLGVLSGISIAILGCYMFLRRATGTATDHSHLDAEAHRLWFFSKRAGSEVDANSRSTGQQISAAQLFTLGITGGIIPCPAALIVLLSAFALHRIALGFFLIVAFSLGLAATLITFGMAMVYARRFMTHLQIDGPLTKRWLPIASSAFITLLGLGVAGQAFAAMHLHVPSTTGSGLGPVLFITGLGIILGMRHSTDADHVVAISTIVSKQRGIRNAALIGSVWGLGHTITIFAVGSLIILFGVEIPPRIGLSMEFCVAIMLIVLGLLNLTGVMQRVSARFTPAIPLSAAVEVGLPAKNDNLLRRSVNRVGLYQFFRPLVIGLVHGLAGSAAVALLVLSTIHNPLWATVYLVIFGMGTLVGMMCMTAAIAVPLAYAGDRFAKLSGYLGVASGMVSVCFGSFLVYQLGFLGGLFTNHPQWTPR